MQEERLTSSKAYYLGKPFVYPPHSVIGRHYIERGRGWDWFLATILPALVEEEEPTICEVGSNIGASLMQILTAKPRAEVLAFEPSDYFRPYLLRNIEFAEAADRVRVYPYLLGREPGEKKLYTDATTGSAVGVRSYEGHELGEEQLVEMVTLDTVMAGERVHFIKVDTDGFEFEVLRGAVNTLKESRPILHLEFTTFLIPEPLQHLAWLQRLGYKRLLCLAPSGEPIGVTEDPSEAMKWAENNTYCDIVTCPEGSKAESRLQSRRLLLSLKLCGQQERLKQTRWRVARLIRKARRLSRRARNVCLRAAHRLIVKLRGPGRLR